MSKNPINLAVRFFLELAALAAMGAWGGHQASGALRWLLAVGIPLVAAALWGTFRFPNDPGKPPVAVPGWARLVLEAVFFGFAAWGLFDIGATTMARVFTLMVLVHYILSYDRIAWMLRGGGKFQRG